MATPAIMDLLFKLISQVEGNDMRTTVIDVSNKYIKLKLRLNIIFYNI